MKDVEKVISELGRLYLPQGTFSPDALAQHVQGQATLPVSLVASDGMARAMVIPFNKLQSGDGDGHWTLLCQVANALQADLGLPAPAVSISGKHGFGLWLSLESPVGSDRIQHFLALLQRAYFPAVELRADAAAAAVELPPCLHRETGRWAAFINPGLGASFADESGLEMAPPLAGQVALLEGLHSISDAQFQHALALLDQVQAVLPEPVPAAPASGALLLKDASLEDIVRHLHARGIEPTFRHLIARHPL